MTGVKQVEENESYRYKRALVQVQVTKAKKRICKLRANPSIHSQISPTYCFSQSGGVLLAGLLCTPCIPQETTEKERGCILK